MTLLRTLLRPVWSVLLLLGLAVGARPAHAQIVKPWMPYGDSLRTMATTARMRFKRQQGDSVAGDNYAAFDIVGQAARKLLRSLGRQNLLQATAIEATLDSLGLDVEVVNDPQLPSIVFMLARNPSRVSSDAVGFLYWYRQGDLRMQGVSFPPSRTVRIRSWWSGRPDAPYEVALTYDRLGTASQPPGFKLFRMNPDGYLWNLIQYEGHSPDFPADARIEFADANRDGQPELLVFSGVDQDSVFTLGTGLHPIQNEFLYTERPEGYVLHNARTIPGPLQALRAWTELLGDRQLERAQRLMLKPERIKEVVANGWVGLVANGSWQVEYGEDAAWSEWYVVRVHTAATRKQYVFHFYIRDGLWVIRDWIEEQENPALHPLPGMIPRDSVRTRRR